MTKLKRLTRLLKTRRRKILAVILTLLLLLTSLRLYLFLNPKEIRAATLELSTTSTTVQIDVAHRYRAIVDKTDDSDDFIVDFYDRAQNDTSPNRVLRLRPEMADPPNYYFIAKDDKRITTILEATSTRVRVRVEGCYSNYTACHSAGTGTITSTIDFTFTAEGISASEKLDFPGGLTLGSGDRVAPLYLYFNTDVSTAHSETVLYGNGETEGTRGPGDGAGTLNGDNDGFILIQGTGSYQDIILGGMNLDGDKFLSNGNDVYDWYDDDVSGEADEVYIHENNPQTIRGAGSVQYFIQFHPQNKLNTETEREAMFNDLINPDYLSHVTGDLWDNKPYGDFLFSSGFEGADPNLCDGGDGWTSASCGSGTTAVGNDTSTTYNGRYSGKFTSGESSGDVRVYKNLGNSYKTFYGRAYFLLDYEGLSDYGALNLLMFQDSTAWQSNYIGISQRPSGALELFAANLGNGNLAGSDGYIQLDTWYEIELKVYRDATNGTLDLWLDGNHILNVPSVNTGNTDMDYFIVGMGGASINSQIFIDNAIVSESYIGTADYNQAEGAYTTDMAVSDAEVDIDAGPNASTLIDDATVEAGDTTFTVDSTTGFPSSGVAYIEGDKFSYTGKTGTTFTGIPSSGELSIIGHADDSVVSSSRRHSPHYKFRNYRKNDVPQSLTLEQNTLTHGAEYNASVKPFTTSYFAQDLTWHSSLESSGAVTSPDVGSGGTVYGTTTFPTGKYGNGALFNADYERISIPTTGGDSANFNKDKGTIEFWYKPLHDHTDNTQHDFSMMWVDDSNTFILYKSSGNQLTLAFNDNGTWRGTGVTSSNYSWKAGEWVHLRFTWDKDASAGETMRIFINGTEPTHYTDSDYTGSFTGGAVLTISVYNEGRYSDGIIDDFRIYNTALTPDPIAKGGNTADSDEYLADPTNDYTFDFNNDDASNRGEYVWLGSDAPFGGVNMDLATEGVGSSEDFDWEYWDGDSWAALTITDQDTGAHSFTADGNFYFTPPADWFPYSVNGSTDLYYIRGHLEDGSYSTDPIENRIQTDILLIHYQDNIIDENQTLFVPGITSGSNPPVVYWNLDEGYGTSANDSSGHGNTGTISGATWQTEDLCYSGKCLYFDGSDDEISRTDDPQFDMNEAGSFSISAWIRHPNIATNPDVIAAKFESTGGDGGYRLQMESDGDISFGIDDENTSFPEDSVTSTSANFDDNRWHHVAAVKDANDNLYLYIDGNLIDTDATISATDSLDNDDDFYLGIDGDGSSNPWAGFIDEFKFYRYVRTPLDVKSDYLTGAATRGSSSVLGIRDYSYFSDGLVGYWKMDENTGQYIYDSSGSGISGTLGADASSGSDDMTWDSGKYGSALTSDGVEDYAKIPDNDLLDVQIGDMTVSAWFITNGDHNTYIVAKDNCGNTNDWLIGVEANGQTSFRLIGDTSVAISHGSSSTLNQWHHVVGVKNGTTMQIYFDGVIKNSATAPTGLAGNSQDVYIGARGGSISNPESCSYPIPGFVDEVRIYNRAFTPSEIEALYRWAPGPVGYWKLDEGSGGSANDSSGNGFTGTWAGSGTPRYVNGKYGKAGNFDGSTDWVYNGSISNSLDLISTTPPSFTEEAWFNIGSSSVNLLSLVCDGSGATCSGANNPDHNYHARLGQTGGNLFFQLKASSTVVTSLDATPLNTWIHVAGVYDSDTNLIKLYVNGIYQGSSTPATTDLSGNTMRLGIGQAQTYFIGQIDDVRVYNYARTQEQIIEDMNAGHPVGGSPLPSQVGYWTFDEGYGDTAYDRTGNNNGNLAGSGSCPGHSDCPTWTNDGKFGKALDFDGTDHFVSVDDNSNLDITEEITLAGWVYPHSGSFGYIIAKGNDATSEWSYAMYDDQDLYLSFLVSGNGSSVTQVNCGECTHSIDTWHHNAITYDGSGTIKFYLDGQLRKTDTSSFSGSMYSGSGDVAIGARHDPVTTTEYEFDGIIDEVKIYNTALTADQVKLDYNQGKAAVWGATSTDSSDNPSWSAQNEYCPPGQGSSCAAPVAHWNFDEKTGSTANDTSGNNNSGSITNGTWKHAGQCKMGACLSFDGSSGRVLVSDSSSLDVTGAITIEAWIYPLGWGGNGYGRILVKSPNDATAPYEFTISDTNDRLGFFTAGVWHYSDDNSISLNEWQRVAVTFDESTDEILFYVNGAKAGSVAETGTINTNSLDVAIGNIESGGRTFHGQIDDVRIYDYARSQAQIAWDYNRGAPVGYWQLDECSGATAYDASGNSNNGTITIGSSGSNTSAGTCTGSSSEAWYNGITGKRNASLDFDGTDDYIKKSISNFQSTDESGTVTAWLKPDDFGSAGYIFSSADEASCCRLLGFSTRITTGKPFIYQQNGGGSDVIDANNGISTGEWSHITWVSTGSAYKIYINGVEQSLTVSSGSNSGDWFADTDDRDNLTIGLLDWNGSQGYRFDGQIDDVRIYNYALTAQQIRDIYNEGAVRFGPTEGSP